MATPASKPKTSDLSGIDGAAAELLEAAGFIDAAALALAGTEKAHAELERANRTLNLIDETPPVERVREWVAEAARLTGLAAGDGATHRGLSPDVREMLLTAPAAIPVPARVLREKGLGVAEIPEGRLLSDETKNLDLRLGSGREPRGRPRAPFDPSKIRSVVRYTAPPEDESKTSRNEPKPVDLLKAPRPETNFGVDPASRRYVRGVLHPHRHQIFWAAAVTVPLQLLIPLSVVSVTLLMLLDQGVEGFEWVPKWLLVFPALLPLFGLLYAFIAAGAKCRICGQRLFAPKHCRKNSKSHYVPGLGFILPLAVHVLLFRWFRCTFCGTSVRVKE